MRVVTNIVFLLMLWENYVYTANRNIKFNLKSFSVCTGPQYSNMESPPENITFQKISRNKKALSMSTTLKQPLGDNTGIKVIMEKWSNNGWIQVPFIPVLKNVCHLLTTNFKKIWIDVLKNFEVKDPNNSCPLPAGNYKLKNFTFDEDSFPRTVYPLNGMVRIKTIFVDLKDHQKITFCLETLVSIEDHMESYKHDKM